MIEIQANQQQILGNLGKNIPGGYMPEAILQGHVGRALTDDLAQPTIAILELADVQAIFLAGDMQHPAVAAYLNNLSKISMIFVADAAAFEPITQRIQRGKWVKLERYAFSSEALDLSKIRELKTLLPEGFDVQRMDADLVRQLLENPQNKFASDHGILFASPEDFEQRGIGYCILGGDTIVCAASSFVVCDGAIEIQIDTRDGYKGKKLATVAAAYLIEYCLENDLDPGWDAANKISAALAKKLGYTPQQAYPMYVYTNSRLLVILRNIVQRFKKLLRK